MATTRAHTRLNADLAVLRETLQGLELTLSDRPQTDGDALAEQLADVATELMGIMEEAAHLAQAMGETTTHSGDLERLVHLQRLLLAAGRRFHDEFAASVRARELARMGQRRRGEWPAWTIAVAGAVDQVWPARFAVEDALHDCLADFAERLSASHPSVAIH